MHQKVRTIRIMPRTTIRPRAHPHGLTPMSETVSPGLPENGSRRRTTSVRPAIPDPPSTTPPAATVFAYTDGACIGNPGPGGWGVYLAYAGGQTLELGGGEEH